MVSISVYDLEARKIEALADSKDTTPAEVIEAIFEAINDVGINIEEYLP